MFDDHASDSEFSASSSDAVFDAPSGSTPAVGTGKVVGVLDGTAFLLSLLCLVHCLALPLMVALLPLVASAFVADEAFHRWMLLAVVPTSVLAFSLGFRGHRGVSMLLLGALGILLLVFAAYGGMWVGLSAAGDTAFTVCGGLALAGAHGINRWRGHHRAVDPRRDRSAEGGHVHGPDCRHGSSVGSLTAWNPAGRVLLSAPVKPVSPGSSSR